METGTEIDIRCGQLEDKFAKYRKYNNPAKAFGGAVAISLIVALALANSEDPNAQTYAIIAFAVFCVTAGIGYYVYRKGNKSKLTSAESSAIYAFRIYNHLDEFERTRTDSTREKAFKELQNLASGLSDRWKIAEKAKSEELEDFDFLLNPTVRLLYLLDKTYAPIIQKGDAAEIVELKNYFMKLARFFLNPTKEGLDELFVFENAPLTKEEKTSSAVSELASKPIIRHIIGLGSSIIAGVAAFYLLSPLSPTDVFQPLAISLGIVGIWVTAYVGLAVIKR